MKTRAPLVALAVVFAAFIPACGSSDSSNTPAAGGSAGDASVGGSAGTGGSAKQPGTEGGPCYPNSTCNAGLTCLSNLCVNAGTGGSGGSDASVGGSGGTAGKGGTAGTSGGAGAGGSAGTGGMGGAAGTGGNAGDAGPDANDCDGGAHPVGTNGDPCCKSSETACAGHAQKLALICDPSSHKWTVLQSCSGAQLCDTSVGTTQGSCQDPVAVCIGKQPGDTSCDGMTAVECGPDLVTSTNTMCSGSTPACLNGLCVACSPASVQCNGLVPQTCDAQGAWQDGTACSGSTPACLDGVCVACSPTSAQCNGLVPQTCDGQGAWQDGTPCSGATVCLAGTCSPCPGSGGPVMVGMPQGYCIDSTEVTASQYSAWLATTPSTTLMPSYCATSWKPSYRPGSGTGNYPVANVDWCDAYAYCKGVGKRLCGKIGGGANAFNDYANAGLSQWFGACSSGGLDTYPYGNTYGAQTCNGKDHGVGATVAVGSMTGCGSSVSGYTGVYDLSGNVYEWEDSCDGNTGQLDYCRLGGGSFGDSDVGLSLACGSLGISPRYYWNPQTGIRCCAL